MSARAALALALVLAALAGGCGRKGAPDAPTPAAAAAQKDVTGRQGL
jgi:predicted small lipoprotein YifL